MSHKQYRANLYYTSQKFLHLVYMYYFQFCKRENCSFISDMTCEGCCDLPSLGSLLSTRSKERSYIKEYYIKGHGVFFLEILKDNSNESCRCPKNGCNETLNSVDEIIKHYTGRATVTHSSAVQKCIQKEEYKWNGDRFAFTNEPMLEEDTLICHGCSCLGQAQYCFQEEDRKHYLLVEIRIKGVTVTYIKVHKECQPEHTDCKQFNAICLYCKKTFTRFNSLYEHYAGSEKAKTAKTGKTSSVNCIFIDDDIGVFEHRPNPWKNKSSLAQPIGINSGSSAKPNGETTGATDRLVLDRITDKRTLPLGKDLQPRKKQNTMTAIEKGLSGEKRPSSGDSAKHKPVTAKRSDEKDVAGSTNNITDKMKKTILTKKGGTGEVMEDKLEYDKRLSVSSYDKHEVSEAGFQLKPPAEELEPVFYSNQINVAENFVSLVDASQRLLDRVLKPGQDGVECFYNDFEFWILTARFNMLEQQTINRLCHREAGILPDDVYKYSEQYIQKYAQGKVHKYWLGKDVQDVYQTLVNRASQEEKTLIFIVADEAHWGITKETNSGRQSAHDVLVNHWNSEEHPNVIILEVSATPYNLLTQNRRFPIDRYVACDLESEELVIGEKNKFTGKLMIDNKETTRKVGPLRDLHHISWSQANSARLEIGIVVVLKVLLGGSFHPDDPLRPVILTVRTERLDEPSGCPWEGTTETKLKETENIYIKEFLIQGKHDVVTIYTPDENYILGVDSKNQLVFMEKSKASLHLKTEFEVHQHFGPDLIGFHSKKPGLKKADVKYDSHESKVDLGHVGNDDLGAGFHERDIEYTWLIEQCKEAGQIDEGRVYCSLTFYYNTMRNEKRDHQKLRYDGFFDKMCTTICKPNQVSGDSVLTADYCLHILMIHEFRKSEFQYSSFRDMVNNIDTAFGSFRVNVQRKLAEFEKNLPKVKESAKPCMIPHIVFCSVREHLAKCTFIDTCKNVEFFNKSRNNENSGNVLQNIISCIIYCTDVQVHDLETFLLDENNLSIQKLSCLGKLYREQKQSTNCDDYDLKQEVFRETETGQIIHDLISTMSEELDGHLKMIRASNALCGNRMYETLVLARTIASQGLSDVEKAYMFEVLRDHDKHPLGDCNMDAPDPDVQEIVYRLRRKSQPAKCEYVNLKDSSKPCKCERWPYETKPGTVKCRYCTHQHRQIIQYSHLNNVNAILILVEKGRMGDTFPPSFNTMDLRLQQFSPSDLGGKQSKKPYLSTMEQELGRMCRYADKSQMEKLPYALIGHPLFKELEGNLKHSATYYNGFVKDNRIDVYVKCTKREKGKQDEESKKAPLQAGDNDGETELSLLEFLPEKNNFDHKIGDRSRQLNRFLLHAPPQVGKTGAFLKSIAMFREIICGPRSEQLSIIVPADEDSNDEDHIEGSTKQVDEENAEDREFPYWKHMEDDKALKDQTVGKSKYDAIYGQYEHGKRPDPLSLSGKSKNNGNKDHLLKKLSIQMPSEKFRAETYIHGCKYCTKDFSTTIKKVAIDKCGEVLVSIPNWTRYESMFSCRLLQSLTPTNLAMTHHSASQTEVHQRQQGGTLDLGTWIFTPSLRRSGIANLNLQHTMVDPETRKFMRYIHVLVVQEEDFDSYCRCWQTTHAIIQLPEHMVDCQYDVKEGGIGFARLFIQRFALALQRSQIIMMDDNIPTMLELRTEKKGSKEVVVRDDHGRGQLVNIPLFKVLKHLEKLFDCEGNILPPKAVGQYICHPEVKQGLHSYTGPSEKYGILGISKPRQNMLRCKIAFRKTNVYSLVMLNLEALEKAGIWYKDYPAREDLNINSDCDEKGLWICKNYKFIMTKQPMIISSLPDIYEWSKNTSLDNMTEGNRPPKGKCGQIIRKWLNRDGLMRVEVYPSKKAEAVHLKNASYDAIEIDDILVRVRSIKKGQHHFVAILPHKRDVNNELDILGCISGYFQKTPGIDGFRKHVLMFSCEFLNATKSSPKTYNAFNLLLQGIFEKDYNLKICTSHNIHEFQVPVLLVCVDGKGKLKFFLFTSQCEFSVHGT